MRELIGKGDDCEIGVELRNVLEGLLQHDAANRFGYDDLVRHS